MEIKSKEITLVDIGEIIPNPNNRNKHSKEQIERLCKIIEYQGFRSPLIISKRSGLLVSGHGRLEAAIKLDLKQVPVIYQEFESDEQEYAAMVSENSIAFWAELDLAGINLDLEKLGPDFDIEYLGIKDFVLDVSEWDTENAKNDKIDLSKIEPPIYQPSREKPSIADLYNSHKTEQLLAQIDTANVSLEEKTFLRAAAMRHQMFNYEKIADYYAHSKKEMQQLMEKSALVIIDVNKAIENGFASLSQEIAETYLEDYVE